MARAKRHFIPGYIWHITHRCHKREFLLKFSKDRHRYMQWLSTRIVIQSGDGYQLRESPASYKVLFEAENEDIDLENTVFWDVKDE